MRSLCLALALGCAPTASAPEPAPPSPAPESEQQPIAVSTPPPPPSPPAVPVWDPVVRPLDATEREAMTDVSWRPGCPVSLDDLRALELPHHTPDGASARGLLVAHADAADSLVLAFQALWQQGFAITRMEPVHRYGGDDGRSMGADNTSAFNCRPVSGGRSWSEHAYGRAVDVNPLRNPFVRGDRVDPPEGRDWLERDPSRPGVLVHDGAAVQAFARQGWRWGGNWRSAKDYQHFSPSGR